MSKLNWDSVFNQWMQGPSETESRKADNAVRMIREAIQAYQPLQRRTLRVFAQGSYRNRTNVRQDSDVDVCVLCMDTFYYDTEHAPYLTCGQLNISPATYDFAEFKTDVHNALIATFGSTSVSRGSKAFDLHENTYRIAADVVPCFQYRLYTGLNQYIEGTTLKSDSSGQTIQNYPDRHYENGVRKHADTNRQFKKKARILKRLRHHLIASDVPIGSTTSSFLVECLAYNCREESFLAQSAYDRTRMVLSDIWEQLEAESTQRNMVEVNDVKYLFHASQPWTLEDAKKCILAMWAEIT